jgi:hypothetical protein
MEEARRTWLSWINYTQITYLLGLVSPPTDLTPRTPQRLQRFQNAGQASLPGTTAFEVGFYGLQRQGNGRGGQHGGNGAHLLGQAVGPGNGRSGSGRRFVCKAQRRFFSKLKCKIRV